MIRLFCFHILYIRVDVLTMKANDSGESRKRHTSGGSGSDSGSDVVRTKKRHVFSDDQGEREAAGSGDDNVEGIQGAVLVYSVVADVKISHARGCSDELTFGHAVQLSIGKHW